MNSLNCYLQTTRLSCVKNGVRRPGDFSAKPIARQLFPIPIDKDDRRPSHTGLKLERRGRRRNTPADTECMFTRAEMNCWEFPMVVAGWTWDIIDVGGFRESSRSEEKERLAGAPTDTTTYYVERRRRLQKPSDDATSFHFLRASTRL